MPVVESPQPKGRGFLDTVLGSLRLRKTLVSLTSPLISRIAFNPCPIQAREGGNYIPSLACYGRNLGL